jgi:hypothetical protein
LRYLTRRWALFWSVWRRRNSSRTHSSRSKKAHFRKLRSIGWQHCGKHSLANDDDRPAIDSKLRACIRYLGIEVEDALNIAEQIELQSSTTGFTPVVAYAAKAVSVPASRGSFFPDLAR